VKTLLLLAALGLLAASSAAAQDSYPKIEVFAGYSFLNTGLTFNRANAHGWGLSLTRNVDKHVGLTLDLAGQYGTEHISFFLLPGAPSTAGRQGFRNHQLLLGPTFYKRSGSVTFFAHQLFGPSRFHSRSATNFTIGTGGGVDLTVRNNIAVRAFQVDYLPTHTSAGWAHDVRIQAGVVFRFGKR